MRTTVYVPMKAYNKLGKERVQVYPRTDFFGPSNPDMIEVTLPREWVEVEDGCMFVIVYQ